MQSTFFANSLHAFQTAKLQGSPQVHALPVLCLRLVVQVSSCFKEANASFTILYLSKTCTYEVSHSSTPFKCAWPNFPALRIRTLRHLPRDTGIGLGRRPFVHQISYISSYYTSFLDQQSHSKLSSHREICLWSLNHLAEAISNYT